MDGRSDLFSQTNESHEKEPPNVCVCSLKRKHVFEVTMLLCFIFIGLKQIRRFLCCPKCFHVFQFSTYKFNLNQLPRFFASRGKTGKLRQFSLFPWINSYGIEGTDRCWLIRKAINLREPCKLNDNKQYHLVLM